MQKLKEVTITFTDDSCHAEVMKQFIKKLSKKWNVSEEEIVENMLDVDILLGYEDTVSRHKERQLQSRILELEQKLELKCEAHQKEMEALLDDYEKYIKHMRAKTYLPEVDIAYMNCMTMLVALAQKRNINIGDEMDTPM